MNGAPAEALDLAWKERILDPISGGLRRLPTTGHGGVPLFCLGLDASNAGSFAGFPLIIP